MPVDLAVISDVHLGTRHCRADELIGYLDRLDTRRLVLNGDIIDLWHMRRHWPTAHAEAVSRILGLARQGVEVHLLIGNHDGALRRFAPFLFGPIALRDRLVLDLDGEKVLFLHGDAAELAHPPHPLLHWVGGHAYDAMMRLGHGVNRLRGWLDLPPVSIVRAFKDHLPCAVRHIARYEESCAALAAEAGCSAVVCGHIHLPRLRSIPVAGRMVEYRNSGDWVEHCSALELSGGSWRLVDAAGSPWRDQPGQPRTGALLAKAA
ncbi:MAG: UDP-2,3-diacylglucosamine diphosphatase [Minicystis sp.]